MPSALATLVGVSPKRTLSGCSSIVVLGEDGGSTWGVGFHGSCLISSSRFGVVDTHGKVSWSRFVEDSISAGWRSRAGNDGLLVPKEL
eukprot:scaffold230742_cov31-Tisochrysis_lutea.AAC.1